MSRCKKIDRLINQYSVSKTLRFSLIPEGRTEEHFECRCLLEEDQQRAKDYGVIKEYIDRYHKSYIEQRLATLMLDDVQSYAGLYYKGNKTDKERDEMEKLEQSMRKKVAKALTDGSEYKRLFQKDLIEELLPAFLQNADEKAVVERFRGFTTYFIGFHENRKNMYTHEAKATAVGYRCINQNLPRFLDNVASFRRICAVLPEADLQQLNGEISGLCGTQAMDAFSVDYFSFVLAQSGIDQYNKILGGYSCEDGTKIKGLNEYINLYNQQYAKNDPSARLPMLKKLYKQILSDRESSSFLPDKFQSDNEVTAAVKTFWDTHGRTAVAELTEMMIQLSEYDLTGIHVSAGEATTKLSHRIFGDWGAVEGAWNREYDEMNPKKAAKPTEKYLENRRKEYKKNASFSLAEIQRLGNRYSTEENCGTVTTYYAMEAKRLAATAQTTYLTAEMMLQNGYSSTSDKKLCANEAAIEQLKNLLDALKSIESLVNPLLGTGKEEHKDEVFYGKFLPLYQQLAEVDRLYDRVRNYVTQKPYSVDKIKLNFQNAQLLNGWDRNKETEYWNVLLRKNGCYYLGIMDKSNKKVFEEIPAAERGTPCYEKMEYRLLPGPNKMLPKVIFSARNESLFRPDAHICSIYQRESFKKGDAFSLKDCHDLIDFYKASIKKYPSWQAFDFHFSPTESYRDISEFYREVAHQGYRVQFVNVPVSYVDHLVETGQLYLFRLHNKDFSPHSHGAENLHTMYFKMLFDPRNQADVVYKLNGEAELFYRAASIRPEEQVVHKANEPIDNKNLSARKKTSTFAYPLIKDRRFTKRQFSLHIPITMNFKASGQEILNEEVRHILKKSGSSYVIGIDRGERHLLYICVINERGEIVEQRSMNVITGDNGHRVDYHQLLDKREVERDQARKSWGTIENIKELKEGYLSQVIHEICRLVRKYDAVIAMEDLSFGFKRGRFRIEKQVYQKFENQLISKLNYLVDKQTPVEEPGGLLKAYQLTNKVTGVHKGAQNGMIFYVPAWLTSKIDPTTGFVDLLRPRYTSMTDAKAFVQKIDAIRWNEADNLFEFDVDYAKFPGTAAAYRKKWTICSNGMRIETFWNDQQKTGHRKIHLTEEFRRLFVDYGIQPERKLKEQILTIDEADFYRRLMHLLSLTLQMRNTGDGEMDVLISPVRNSAGIFFDSRDYEGTDAALPTNADANGAYNIARKAQWTIERLRTVSDGDLRKAKISISNAEWLEYTQK